MDGEETKWVQREWGICCKLYTTVLSTANIYYVPYIVLNTILFILNLISQFYKVETIISATLKMNKLKVKNVKNLA